MNPNFISSSIKLRLRSSPVDQSTQMNRIRVPKIKILPDLSNKTPVKLIGKSIGGWDPSEKIKCMICWQPLDIHGKDAGSYMECRHCHQKAQENRKRK